MEIVREEWRPIPGHDGYEASNHGRIKSLSRTIHAVRNGTPFTKTWKGRILVAVLHRGYLVAKLGKCKRVHGVHQYVAWAFIGPQSPGMVVNHIDGCKTNNRPENLEIIPNSENVDHAYRTGLKSSVGKSNGRAILTESQVKEIKAGMSSKEARERFGIGRHVVWQIKSGKTWRHVAAE